MGKSRRNRKKSCISILSLVSTFLMFDSHYCYVNVPGPPTRQLGHTCRCPSVHLQAYSSTKRYFLYSAYTTAIFDPLKGFSERSGRNYKICFPPSATQASEIQGASHTYTCFECIAVDHLHCAVISQYVYVLHICVWTRFLQHPSIRHRPTVPKPPTRHCPAAPSLFQSGRRSLHLHCLADVGLQPSRPKYLPGGLPAFASALPLLGTQFLPSKLPCLSQSSGAVTLMQRMCAPDSFY